MTRMIKGSDLPIELQRQALAAFPYRYTRDHTPTWATKTGLRYPVQFASDADWLAHTLFAVAGPARALRLSRRERYCESTPTWPDGKGPALASLHNAKCEPFKSR